MISAYETNRLPFLFLEGCRDPVTVMNTFWIVSGVGRGCLEGAGGRLGAMWTYFRALRGILLGGGRGGVKKTESKIYFNIGHCYRVAAIFECYPGIL